MTLRRVLAIIAVVTLANASVLNAAGGQDDLPPGRIAFIRRGDVWVWNGGEANRLIADGAASDPRWSPSGQFMIFVRSGDSYSNLVLHDFDSGTETLLTHNQSDAQEGSPDYVATSSWALDPDWSPSGLIAFASDNTSDNSMILWMMSDPDQPPEPAPEAQVEDDVEAVSLSADGTVAAYTVRSRGDDGTNRTYVALRDLTDGTAYVIAEDPAGAFDPAIAPDNQHIAVTIRADDGVTDIWLVDRATGARTRITTGAQATKPAWSPDGRWLAYMRMIDFQFEVWAVPIDRTTIGAPHRLFRFKNLDATSRVSWTLS
jgi:Tol biopolymer transport system component